MCPSDVTNLSLVVILLRIDNSTAIAYINKMVGVQYAGLNTIAREIWRWCEDRSLWTKENKKADLKSRKLNVDIEWELADWACRRIVKSFVLPDIDLFASRHNHKVEKYCAWRRDPDALTVDAFTFSWSHYFVYAFPSFSLILRVLKNLIQDKAEGLMVVPLWYTDQV